MNKLPERGFCSGKAGRSSRLNEAKKRPLNATLAARNYSATNSGPLSTIVRKRDIVVPTLYPVGTVSIW